MMAGLLVSILIGMSQSIGVSGNIPEFVGPSESPGRISWLPARTSPDDGRHECVLAAASRWSCPSVPAGESGVVVVFGDGVIGYVVVGPAGAAWGGRAEWGRLVRITPGDIGLESLGDLRISSWTVDRPAGRPNTQKLDVIPDTTLQVIKVSDTSFWISGPIPSTDAFLRLDGPGVARHDIVMRTVAAGPPDSPFVIDATNGVSITGRVEARSGEPVEGALVELFAKFPGNEVAPGDERALAKIPVVRLATAVTDGDGQFEFSGLENGAYQVVATAFSRGRLARWTTTARPPLLMTLEPPAKATGRVVRHKLPAPGVKVRFVPASTAWRNSSDPSAHLTTDVSTDQSGRFTLALPPQPSGDVQFIAPDGASTRVTLPALANLSEVALGDVTLPELIAVEIRADVADVAGCRMTAIGPAGALGLALVPGRPTSTIYQFDLPEPGQWFLDAECSGQHVSIQPAAIQVNSTRSLPSFYVHFVTDDTARSR
jgi:hypothetical protein